MSDFLTLFELFAASDVCYSIMEILIPILLIYSAFSLIGVILHGKYV